MIKQYIQRLVDERVKERVHNHLHTLERNNWGDYNYKFKQALRPLIQQAITEELSKKKYDYAPLVETALEVNIKEKVKEIIEEQAYNEAFLDDVVERLKRKQVK